MISYFFTVMLFTTYLIKFWDLKIIQILLRFRFNSMYILFSSLVLVFLKNTLNANCKKD